LFCQSPVSAEFVLFASHNKTAEFQLYNILSFWNIAAIHFGLFVHLSDEKFSP
jgi:hypothetical protein